MRSIYILLTRSKTLASRLVYLATEAQYTHSSLAFEEDLDDLYSFGRKYPRLILPAGLQVESLRRGFYKRYNDIPCVLYAFRVEDEAYDAARAIVNEMVNQAERYSYNIFGLLSCKLGIVFDRRNKYFCSEFVAEVLDKSGAIKMPRAYSLMHPMDFTRLPGAIRLYEGNVGDLLEKITRQIAEEACAFSTSAIPVC